MKTDWSDQGVNPSGIELVEAPSPEAHLTTKVLMNARLLGRFKDKDGNLFVSAFVGDKKRVFRFNAACSAYEESLDQGANFLILRMTEEFQQI